MSVDVKMKYGICPSCGERTHVTSWSREPRETTHEQPGIPTSRTYEPGPEATVVLDCGHVVIDGAEAIEQLLATFKPDASGELQ